MPWGQSDAHRHTHLVKSKKDRELWAKIANEVLGRTGDDAQAIREANAVIHKQKSKKK